MYVLMFYFVSVTSKACPLVVICKKHSVYSRLPKEKQTQDATYKVLSCNITRKLK